MNLITFIGLGVGAAIVAHSIRRMLPPPFLVRSWADDNAFRILDCRYRMFSQGPFAWKTRGRGSTAYYVHIRGQQGQERFAWVLCISEWGPGRTEVEWDVARDSPART